MRFAWDGGWVVGLLFVVAGCAGSGGVSQPAAGAGEPATTPVVDRYEKALADERKFVPDSVPEGDVGAMTALHVGDHLEAANQYGSVVIDVTSATRRSVTVKRKGEAERHFDVELSPRDRPYRGMTGLYVGHNYAPDRSPIVMQDGMLFVTSIDSAKRKLAEVPSMGYVIDKDGLAIGIYDPKGGYTFNLDVIQIMVGKAKPDWPGPSAGVHVTRKR